MKPPRIAVVASVSAVVGATLAIAVTAAFAGDRKPSTPMQGKRHAQPILADVNFVSSCRFSHRRPDDPIVAPGQPGASHDHTFVGNRTTSAFSTVETLLAGATSCRRAGDTAAYWVPTLYANGHAIAPLSATIYYRRSTLDHVQPFPSGLKMIAGDAHAASMAQDLRVVFWSCGVAAGVPPSATPPTCPAVPGSGLRLHVRFPSCWDGANLDSPDHKSHMAYPMRRVCPASHPVSLPAITLIYHYPILDGSSVALSSGGQLSGHADFLNAWNQAELTRLVDSCLNALRHCGRGD
jgi:hypothetical protein